MHAGASSGVALPGASGGGGGQPLVAGKTISAQLVAAEQAFVAKCRRLHQVTADSKSRARKAQEDDAFRGALKDVQAPGGAAGAGAALRARDTILDASTFKVALMERDTEWDAAHGKAFIAQLPDFGFDGAAGNNNAVTLQLKYRELADTDRLYAAVHIASTADVTPDTVYCHFTFRRDPKKGGQVSVAYRLRGGEWSGHRLTSGKELPFEPETPFFIRIVFVSEGFLVYHGDKLFPMGARHQPDEARPPPGSPLYLNIPTGGDAGERSSLQCMGAWFGAFRVPPPDLARMSRPKAGATRVYVPGEVYVTSVPDGAGMREIADHFAEFAPENVELHPERFAATVTLTTKSTAQVDAAVKALHNSTMMGQRIGVAPALAKFKPGAGAGAAAGAGAGR